MSTHQEDVAQVGTATPSDEKNTSSEVAHAAAAEPAVDAAAAPAPEVAPAPDGGAVELGPAAAEAELAPLSLRQTVALQGSSCDIRLGDGVLERLGRDLRLAVGKPRRAVLLYEPDCAEDLVTRAKHLVTDGGFLVDTHELPDADQMATTQAVGACYEVLAAHGLTADDAIVGIGGTNTLSALSFVASTWCGGMIFDAVPRALDAVIRCPASPLPLVPARGYAPVVQARPRMTLCHADTELLRLDQLTDAALTARALMVKTAVCESKDAFNSFVVRSTAIAEGELEPYAKQALDAARGIGRLLASTSVAVRKSLTYGELFGRALMTLVGPRLSEGLALAEGMRFAARLAVDAVEGDIDFVFTQDALLDRMGLHAVSVRVDPAALEAEIKRQALTTANRYLFAVPYALGRVRLTAVEDDILAEHVAAFCATRAAL